MKWEIDPSNPFLLEPLTPGQIHPDTVKRATELVELSGRLAGYFSGSLMVEIQTMVRSMNGYYSNLIEGHKTRPIDIEKALHQKFEGKPKEQEYQRLHFAHLATQTAMENWIANDPSRPICTAEFLSFIHREFYSRLPESFRVQQDEKGAEHSITPGNLRDHYVKVGRHIPPPSEALPAMLTRFGSYESLISKTAEGLTIGMAAHHRLAWIHPFGDGNGRVTRLFTHAWLLKAGLSGIGLWTLARGLARRLDEYRRLLDLADQPRQSDLDGRGARSEKNLNQFCDFMIEVALDQVRFMTELLQPETFFKRVQGYCLVQEAQEILPRGSANVYLELLRRGRLDRGGVAPIIHRTPRTAQSVIRQLLEQGYCKTPSPKGALLPLLPASASAFFFPDLYPTDYRAVTDAA